MVSQDHLLMAEHKFKPNITNDKYTTIGSH
jgi:hypothetical protein